MCSGLLPASKWLSRLHEDGICNPPACLGPRHGVIVRNLQNNMSCPAQHGKMHQIGVPWTNLFTDLETWNSFTISHSYPHTLICFCHQALMSTLSRGLNQRIMFSSSTEGTKRAFLWVCLSEKDGRAGSWLWRIGPLVHLLHQATFLQLILSWILTSNSCLLQ